MLRFFARATAAGDETGTGRVMIVIRRNGVDSNSSYEGDFSIGREWQEILIPFEFAKDFAVDEAAIMLRFGFKRQTLEIGGLQVFSYGKSQVYASLPRTSFSYVGREPDAPWRKEALARIQRLRQSDFVVHVKDASGKPVSGVKVQANETRSAFEWGSALQMARLVQDSPDNRIYRQKVLELFNAASTENDLKWPAWIGEWEGSYSKEQTLAGLHWIKDHGLDARGHVLVWPGKKNLPESIVSLLGTPRQGEIPGLVEAHIREMAAATKGLVTEWDVLNEPYTNHDLMDVFGPEIMPTWFKVARQAMPTTRLFFNDFSNHDATTDADHVAHYERTIRFLLEHGAPVTGLGIQAHFGGRPNAPQNILNVFDRYYNEFHLPMRITEFDVWTYDEPLQADFTRDFLILCYSHPAVIGVQFWGFWSRAHWRPVAGMFRDDWSERPIAQVYRDLVLHQWRTQTGGTTDGAGMCQLRGYQGTYTIAAEFNGQEVDQTYTLASGTSSPDVTITLP
jgi:GH35 family endo-1,4-beta-xylanase